MRRVVITGLGIVSSVGNNAEEVTQSLKTGRSGIVAAPDYAELGFRSQVKGAVQLDVADHVDRKQLRFMGEGAAYAVLAMEQAVMSTLATGGVCWPIARLSVTIRPKWTRSRSIAFTIGKTIGTTRMMAAAP